MEFIEKKRWVFFGLPFTFRSYQVNENLITIHDGCFKKTENDCYMYKVQDVELVRSFWERIFGLGTVKCYTGDTTDKVLELVHIHNAKEIKDFILQVSEEARLKRRTLNMLDISVANDHDCDCC